MLDNLRKAIPQNHFLRRWYSAFQAIAAAIGLGFPSRGLQIIAVTGTDGKTTTAEMISFILQHEHIPLLSITTAAICLDHKIMPSSKRTTPSPWQLNRLFRMARKTGIQTAVIEVSSHALCQRRVFGIQPVTAVLTNITPEHLDYHGDIDSYRTAKKLLFTRYLQSGGTAVINLDDTVGSTWKSEFAASGKKVITYSVTTEKPADLKAENTHETEAGIAFDFHDVRHQFAKTLSLSIKGVFNAENALAAIGAAQAFGISSERASAALELFPGVPGRMEEIAGTNGFRVFVDFALTTGALTKALASAREIANKGRVICVFGSAGNHPDVSIRNETGKIAATLADVVIVTDDEPYFEDATLIRSQIMEGVREVEKPSNPQKQFYEIADRREAIYTAISLAQIGDVVLISGMGHLNTRNIGGNEIPWNDADVIRECLNGFYKIHENQI